MLVGVAASSVNGTDLGLRRGAAGPLTWGRLPLTLGFDLSGTVLACGPQVSAFAVGEDVVGLLDHSGGAQAEMVVVDQSRLAAAPTTVALTHAAALPLAGLTALQALHTKAHLHSRPSGTRVLAIGATGGIGAYATQLAALAGAHVSALARREILPVAARLGAHDLLAREDGPLPGRGRFDVIIDTAGALPAGHLSRVLRPGGVVVSVRPVDPAILRAGVTRWLGRRSPTTPGPRSLTAVATRARSQDLARLARLVDSGDLRIPVQAVLGADHAAQAHRLAESATPGKVVITMEPALA
ncbi:NAD(P)-dependent alcohol dehydrogenase [Pseudokineococcus marinus]|uniref:NAD(P)-dependent alcohol dehydrogenase n=1 Tax=Pseudokineococcus marinus TaxID=351215 RepID=A0A849BGF1_9ACTN|nr:NAD(P)-dependent alcohol dehydrogenase [Pseudokineococcus marinus]NNH22170.1 NAD(P)-dependent alcohol dehydrogenase [Pseudokineococcus marinus]